MVKRRAPSLRPPSMSPVTAVLVVLIAGAYVAAWSTGSNGLLGPLGFTSDLSRPWSVLTFPFACAGTGREFFGILCSVLWLSFVGTWAERALGRFHLLAWFFGTAVAAAFLAYLVALATGVPASLYTAWIPVAALTGLWAGHNPSQRVLFMFVINIEAKWLALISGLVVMFAHGTGLPILGIAVALPVLVAWFAGKGAFVRSSREVVSGRGQKAQSAKEFDEFIEKVRGKEKEREERDRLRRLLEGTPSDGSSDPED
ncbi:MAG: rhomboid family intramembrane serine protease [Armatimonadetes bacterium]|nr:rhomboid family intramembrane serine protease [Armatimonadota bacterium]